MEKKLISISIILLFLSLYLSGCNMVIDPEKQKFIGTWYEINKEIGIPTNVTFYENGTFRGGYWPLGDTWELENGTILMSFQDEIYGIYYYEFNEGNTTTLTLKNIKSNESIYFEK